MAVVVFGGKASERAEWEPHLRAAVAASQSRPTLIMDPTEAAPDDVDYVLTSANGDVSDLGAFANLKGILSLWAGVEELLARPDLPADVPLARMVEPGLTYGMTDYVIGHVMRAHLGIDRFIKADQAGEWLEWHPPLSTERRVGVIGLGALGLDVAEKLVALRFQTRGWSRTRKEAPGVTCFAGAGELPAFAEGLDILVVLAPQTPETIGLVDGALLAHLADGAHLINAARGPLVRQDALLAALDAPSGLAGATLDVFDEEPLAPDHPYWAHPAVLVTPHIASVTRPQTASTAVLAQIDRAEAGEGLRHVVDRGRGY